MGNVKFPNLFLGNIQSSSVQNINLGLILTTDDKGKIHKTPNHQQKTTHRNLNYEVNFPSKRTKKGITLEMMPQGKEMARRINLSSTCTCSRLCILYLGSGKELQHFISAIPHKVPKLGELIPQPPELDFRKKSIT